ncbi:ribosomal protein S18-alanine N-acetyltransferase [Corynebacterium ulceribovis]|uniref:ribosomal protein S18-alanine N-acetyltransferase n=1 Tax=Corynebacterium ulceribovis TaxID=487732 RepID=UPI00037F2D3A|nr:ribosomal protein S18-alanine N-acetyltransferase [Corynebacterium ulceribovis]
MQVIELDTSYADACARIEAELFADDGPWSAAAFREELAGRFNQYFGILIDGELAGFAGVGRFGPADDPGFEVHTVGVSPRQQRQGLGRKLMHQLLAVADAAGGPVHLEVRTDNVPAIALYEDLGFERIGIRRNYYRPSGADALTMIRPAAEVPAGHATSNVGEN